MKYYFSAFILCLSLSKIFSQNTDPSILWSTGFSAAQTALGEPGIHIYDISVDPIYGDVYIAAKCSMPCTFPDGQTLTPSPNGELLALIKIDAQGAVEWVKNLGFVGALSGGARICAISSGGVCLAGHFSTPSLDFGNGVIVNRNCSGDCEAVFLACFDFEGTAQWAQTVYGTDASFFFASGVETDQTGTIYLSGNYEGTSVRIGASQQHNNLVPNSFFLASYKAADGSLKAVHFVDSTSGIAKSIQLAVNTNGQAIITGPFEDHITFDNGLSLHNNSGVLGFFVAGLNASGAAQWIKEVGSSDYASVFGIDIDQEGKAYLAIDASTDLLVNDSIIPLNNNSYFAGVVLKLDATAFSVPVIIPYNTVDFAVMDVQVDPYGNIITTGFNSEPVEFGGMNVAIDGCTDALISATSSEGVPQWAKSVGGSGCELIQNFYYASTMDFDAAGYLYTAGLYTGSFTEDGITLQGNGAFIAKFNTSIVATQTPDFQALQISPNPCNGNFTIHTEALQSHDAQLYIHDLSGRQWIQQTIVDPQMELNTTLPQGAYVVTLQTGSQIQRAKLIIQH